MKIDELLEKLEDNVNYVVIFKLRTSNNVWIIICKQMIITNNSPGEAQLVSPPGGKWKIEEIYNRIQLGIDIHTMKYNIEEGNVVVIKYRKLVSKIEKVGNINKNYKLSLYMRKKGDIKS